MSKTNLAVIKKIKSMKKRLDNIKKRKMNKTKMRNI